MLDVSALGSRVGGRIGDDQRLQSLRFGECRRKRKKGQSVLASPEFVMIWGFGVGGGGVSVKRR